MGETRIIFRKLEASPTPEFVTHRNSVSEPITAPPIGETITLKKAEDDGTSSRKPGFSQQELGKEDKVSPETEPSAKVTPSESWVIIDEKLVKEEDEKLAKEEESIADQPSAGPTVSPVSDVKQAWSESSSLLDGVSVAQLIPTAPSNSGVSGEGVGKDIQIEDMEDAEMKANRSSVAVNYSTFTAGDLNEENEEPEEMFSTPLATTPQVNSTCTINTPGNRYY